MSARALISRAEAAQMCGVSVDTFDKYVRSQVLTKKIGRRVLVDEGSVLEWVGRRKGSESSGAEASATRGSRTAAASTSSPQAAAILQRLIMRRSKSSTALLAPVRMAADKRPDKVYFIRSGERGKIKIGHSVDPASRLSSLQTAHSDELRLLATMDGGGAKEQELHHRFSHLRLIGEWFSPEPELLTFIEGLPQ